MFPRAAFASWLCLFLIVPVAMSFSLPQDGETYKPRLPITIDGDKDLLLPAEISGVVGGRGTAEDPYRIEGWEIHADGGHAVRIANTSAHVIVRDNYLRGHGPVASTVCFTALVVSCYDLRTVCVTNPVCMPGVPADQVGLELRHVRNARIEGNRIEGQLFGLRAEDIQDVVIRANIVSLATAGTRADAVTFVNVAIAFTNRQLASKDIQFYRPQGIGIVLNDFSNVVLSENVVADYVDGPDVGFFDSDLTLLLERGSGIVQDNVFQNNEGGLNTENVQLLVKRNTFSAINVSRAFLFSTGSVVDLQGNLFVDAIPGFICGVGTEVSIRGNVFERSGVHGSALSPYCPNEALFVTIEGNTFSLSSAALTARGVIRGNTFDGGGVPLVDGGEAAIWLQWYPVDVRGNTVRYADVGVHSRGSSSVIEENLLFRNDRGVVAFGHTTGGRTEVPVLRNNSILGGRYAVFNTDAAHYDPDAPPGEVPVDALWNWWGSPDGPEPGSLYGNVTVDPWLTYPPGPTGT